MSTSNDDEASSLLWKIIEIVGTPLTASPADFESLSTTSEAVEALCANPEQTQKAVDLLFPNGVPTNAEVYVRLNRLDFRLASTDAAHRLVGTLWAVALEKLERPASEELLRAFTLDQRCFIYGLDWFPTMLRRHELRIEFAAGWFPSLVKRSENSGGELWKAFGVFLETHLQQAVEILRRLGAAEEECEIAFAAYVQGALRAVDLPADLKAEFQKVEQRIATDARPGARSIYHRSWVESAQRGGISRAEFETLAARMDSGSADEQHAAFWIVTGILRSSRLSPDCFEFGMEWLRIRTNPEIPPPAKYQVIDFVARQAHEKRWGAVDLVLALQPLLAEHKGIWARLEPVLVMLLRHSSAAFSDHFLKLAQRSARPLLEVMQAPNSFDWLLQEMAVKDLGEMVGQLCLSEDSDCRKLGLFLFDELELSSLSSALLDTVGENAVASAFFELRRTSVHGPAIARYLVLLIPCMERASETLQKEFYDELVLQLKNFPGGCRDECHRRAGEFPILQKAIAEADRYFDSLNAIGQSSINAMDVPGFRQAARMYARRFAEKVSKGAEEMSVFMQLFKKVQLLYGKGWRTFHGGELSATSGLQEFSHSIEIPRLELIDPEGMNLRRIHASSLLGDSTHASADAKEDQ